MLLKAAFFIFLSVSIINSYLDLKTMHISIVLNYIGFGICVLLYLINSPRLLVNNLLGSILLFLVFLLVWKLSHKGFGWGDIHYSLFCGLISGFPGFIFSGLIAALAGLTIFLFIKLFSSKKSIKKVRIPFIPLMFAGTLCELLFADFFCSTYIKMNLLKSLQNGSLMI